MQTINYYTDFMILATKIVSWRIQNQS